MDIYFGRVYKRTNSTLRPSTESMQLISCMLKYPVDTQNPSVTVDGAFNITYNYAYIPELERYYYISKIDMLNGSLFEVSLSEDLLATYKKSILNTKAYVQYASHSDSITLGRVPDNRYAIGVTPVSVSESFDLSLVSNSSYHYIITVSGNSDNSAKFSNTYFISQPNLAVLANFLYSSDIWDTLAKQYSDAFGCILSFKRIKLNIDESRYPLQRIYLGNYDSGANGRLITGMNLTAINPITYTEYYSGLDRFNPYTYYNLFLPYVGNIPLNPLDLPTNRIRISTVINIMTNTITYKLEGGSDNNLTEIGFYNGNIGQDLPISSYSSNGSGFINSALGLVNTTTQAISGNVIGAVSSGIDSIGGMIDSYFNKTIQKSGSIGGNTFEGIGDKVILTTTHYDKIGQGSLNDIMGQPVMLAAKLSAFSGYVKTIGASVSSDGLSGELDTVNSLLDGGIYIE